LNATCNSRVVVRLDKLPMVRRILFCRRCNFNKWLSAAPPPPQAGLACHFGPNQCFFWDL